MHSRHPSCLQTLLLLYHHTTVYYCIHSFILFCSVLFKLTRTRDITVYIYTGIAHRQPRHPVHCAYPPCPQPTRLHA